MRLMHSVSYGVSGVAMSMLILWYEFRKGTSAKQIAVASDSSLEELEELAVKHDCPEVSGHLMSTLLAVLGLDYKIRFPRTPEEYKSVEQAWEMGYYFVLNKSDAQTMVDRLRTARDIDKLTEGCVGFTESGEDPTELRPYVEISIDWLIATLENLPEDRFGMLAFS